MAYISFSGEEYFSIEEYIKESIRQNVSWINFKDLEDFKLLFERGLLKEGTEVRTSDQGDIDECYVVTKEGFLFGVKDGEYVGRKGVHKPQDILNGKRISSGWVTPLEGRFGFNFKKSLNV